jgi:hypothetical protein
MGLSRFLLPLGALILSTGAWKLDPKSCGVDGDALADHLKSSVNDAFDLVSGALTELQKPERSTDVNRLLELLFCPEGTAGRDYNVNHLTETFEGILAMSTEVTEANYHNKDDFVSISPTLHNSKTLSFPFPAYLRIIFFDRSCSATEIASRTSRRSPRRSPRTSP